VESFIMDFQGDLYDQEVRLEFASRLRGEMRFQSREALLAQIARDVEQARALLASRGPRGYAG
jgi:riboflavin kinase/FMN adenylyltransferase